MLQTSEDPPAPLGNDESPKSRGSIPSPTNSSSGASPTHAHVSHGAATEEAGTVSAPDDVASDAGSSTPTAQGNAAVANDVDPDAELFSADGTTSAGTVVP